MTTRVIPVGRLDEEQVRSVLYAAAAAPSLLDSRPWRLHCTAATIELHVGTRRATPDADAGHRDVMLSCGAALLNLRLAIRSLGVHPDVRLLPDPHRPDLLAIVRPHGRATVSPVDRNLADAVFRRRISLGSPSSAAVPLSVVAGLRQAAKVERAWLPTLTAAQLSVLRGWVNQAAQDSGDAADPYWSGHGASDGGVLPQPLVAVVATFHDLPLARLQAGQAMQRVLLEATVAGLSSSFLSRVVEVPTTRRQLRDLIVGGLWPQAVLRVGYGSSVAAIARRDLDDVLTCGWPTA